MSWANSASTLEDIADLKAFIMSPLSSIIVIGVTAFRMWWGVLMRCTASEKAATSRTSAAERASSSTRVLI